MRTAIRIIMKLDGKTSKEYNNVIAYSLFARETSQRKRDSLTFPFPFSKRVSLAAN